MERAAWTDERLDDLSAKVDSGFERVDRDIRELRGELHTGLAGVRSEVEALRQTMLRVGGAMLGGMMVGFLSVIAAVLTRAS